MTTTYGSPDNDVLIGIDSSETMYGSKGDDRLLGYGGDDVLIGGTGDDTIDGGAGTDTVQFDGHFSGFRFEADDGYLEVKHAYRSEERFENMGEDKLKNVETLAFWDRTISISTLTEALSLTLTSGNDDSDDDSHDDDSHDDDSHDDDHSHDDDSTTTTTTTTSSGADSVTLHGTPEKDTLIGGDGADVLSGGLDGDRLLGGAGDDRLTGGMGDDTIEGGAGTDTAIFDGHFAGFRFKRLSNGALQAKHFYHKGSAEQGTDELKDVETLAFWDRTVSVSTLTTLLGLDTGSTVTTSSAEDVVVGGETETEIELNDDDDHVKVSGLKTVRGGTGRQWVDLSSGGNSLSVSGVETLIGGADNDWVTLGDTGNTTILAAVETLIGGSGGDWINLGARGATMILVGVETLIGGRGDDHVHLGARGSTMILAGVESLIGGRGDDHINLGARGSTMSLSGVETLVGGAGADVITLSDAGNTLILASIETLAGGAGTDVISLGARGVTITVSNVEKVLGGRRADDVTVTEGGTCFLGGRGADVVHLATGSGAGADVLAYRSLEDGGEKGDNSGYDLVVNFNVAADKISIRDDLASLIDHDDDGVLDVATRGAGGLDLASDELVYFSSTVSSLTDGDFAAFRTALGSVAAGSGDGSTLVLAGNGTDTALYAVSASKSGALSADDVRLLSVFSGVSSPSSMTAVFGV